jgi:O-antigen/teichoic acid export membrane protein
MKNLIKNMRYTVSANVITLVISILITLLLPRRLGVQNYGYFQLYLFYTSYASIFHFGLPDGIYLRYGGEYYENVDKNEIKEQFVFLSLLLFMLSFFSMVYSFLFIHDDSKSLIILASIISIFLTNLRVFFLFLLQATNRIKEYAKYTRLDRILFFVFAVFYIFFVGSSFKIIIGVDLLSRTIALVGVVIVFKDVLFNSTNFNLKRMLIDAYRNIKIGSKLMISYIAGLLIIGIIRFGIERSWSIEVFGKVSLVLSLSNMMLTFINAVSVVLFPMLRRIDTESQQKTYIGLRELCIPTAFSLLLVYWPVKYIISLWLPQYADSLIYLGILFPIFIYEGKVSLLSNTFLKTLRKEKSILLINVSSLSLSLILAIVSIYIFHNLTMSIISILLVIIFRSNFSEILVCKYIKLNYSKSMIYECVLTLLFVLTNLYMNSFFSFLFYLMSVIIYLLFERKKIKKSFLLLKDLK